jgi:hypothetical protein
MVNPQSAMVVFQSEIRNHKSEMIHQSLWLVFRAFVITVNVMSKVIAGIFTIVGGLTVIYYIFVMINSSYLLNYNDPKLHQSMFQTGHMVPLVFGILLTVIGLVFFFVAREPNPDMRE